MSAPEALIQALVEQGRPPLLELFARLREAGLPLGLDAYLLLLRALRAGFGLEDRAALRRLCHTLWTSSREEQALLDWHFELLVPELLVPELPHDLPALAEPPARAEPVVLDPPQAPASSAETPAPDPAPQADPGAPLAIELRAHAFSGLEVAGPPAASGDYLPVTRRQLKQGWRSMRRLVRTGPPSELDLDATMRRIGREGFMLAPVLLPPRVNRMALLLLIDVDGSMVPFHALGARLAETARRGGRLGQAGVCYFHNAPAGHLYRDPSLVEAEPLDALLARLPPRHSAALIFSDAGAARGGLNRERVMLTEALLARLRRRVRGLAWLNPMPRERWAGSSAGLIARSVPMFELSRPGLERAVDVLRGRHVALARAVQP